MQVSLTTGIVTLVDLSQIRSVVHWRHGKVIDSGSDSGNGELSSNSRTSNYGLIHDERYDSYSSPLGYG